MSIQLLQFSYINGVLCRHITIDGININRLVIPTGLVETVLRFIHDMLQDGLDGHPGRDKTFSAARRKFYRPTIHIDVEKHVTQCLSCAQT